MTNGPRGNSAGEEEGSGDDLGITQALELNKVKINNLTAKNCGKVNMLTPGAGSYETNGAEKVTSEKSKSQSDILEIHPFISIFNTCEFKIQEEIEKAVQIEQMKAASSTLIKKA